MIEKNIADIKKSHLKTAKTLKIIQDWQVEHEKSDIENFKQIHDAIKAIPSATFIQEAVASAVKVTVNGHILDIEKHLVSQDENLEEFRKQIKPYSVARTWAKETGQVIFYLGTLCLSVVAIIEFLKWIRVLN